MTGRGFNYCEHNTLPDMSQYLFDLRDGVMVAYSTRQEPCERGAVSRCPVRLVGATVQCLENLQQVLCVIVVMVWSF